MSSRDDILRMRAEGASHAQIAKALGCSKDKVRYWLRPEVRGARGGTPPKPETWVEKAREMRAAGMSYWRIGAEVGVTHHTIRYHLDPEARAKRLGDQRESNKLMYRIFVEKVWEKYGVSPEKLRQIRHHCRELAAQQGRPVEELYREFGVER